MPKGFKAMVIVTSDGANNATLCKCKSLFPAVTVAVVASSFALLEFSSTATLDDVRKKLRPWQLPETTLEKGAAKGHKAITHKYFRSASLGAFVVLATAVVASEAEEYLTGESRLIEGVALTPVRSGEDGKTIESAKQSLEQFSVCAKEKSKSITLTPL